MSQSTEDRSQSWEEFGHFLIASRHKKSVLKNMPLRTLKTIISPSWTNAFAEEKLPEGKSLLARAGMRGPETRRYQLGQELPRGSSQNDLEEKN